VHLEIYAKRHYEQIVENPNVDFEVLILSYIMFLLNATFVHNYQLFWTVTDNTLLGRKLIIHSITIIN